MRCAIWYHVYNLKNLKNTLGGLLLLVKVAGVFQVFKIVPMVPNCVKQHYLCGKSTDTSYNREQVPFLTEFKFDSNVCTDRTLGNNIGSITYSVYSFQPKN